MANEGWIRLHRQLQENPLWKGERFTRGQAWVDLILLANHKDNQVLFNGSILEIKRGQFLTSIVKLAEKWKWDRRTVSSYLNMLEKEQMITKSTDNRKTLITIENYGFYQCTEDNNAQLNAQQSTHQNAQQNAQPMHSRMHTNNNDKNDNNIHNTYIDNARAREEGLTKTDIPLTIRRI